MPMPRANTWYAVTWIDGRHDGELAYCGVCLTSAAMAFVPGTCHATGTDYFDARRKALAKAEEIRKGLGA